MTVATDRVLAQDLTSSRVKTAYGDVLMTHPDRTWEQFKCLQKGFKGSRDVKLFYLDKTIEILMPGRAHELFKSVIGFLLELFLLDQRVEFLPIGSMTREKDCVASAEPDESYEIQGFNLSIEVNFTSGNISKLERYKVLETDEVWLWEDGVLKVYHLSDGSYERVENSLIPALSALDISLFTKCVLLGETSRIQAADRLREAYAKNAQEDTQK